MTEIALHVILTIFLWTYHAWSIYLSYRQYRICALTETIPNDLKILFTEEFYKKSRAYTLEDQTLFFFKNLFEMIISSFVINSGIFADIWCFTEKILCVHDEVIISCVWLFFLLLFNEIIYLPFKTYSTFIIEEKHGFNRETIDFFLIDRLKTVLVKTVIYIPLALVLIPIIGCDCKFYSPWAAVIVEATFASVVTFYPVYIAPYFDDYLPLKDGVLKTSLQEMALKSGYPEIEIYIVDRSKRSKHANAFCTGLFQTSRIVIYDTLLKHLENSEIVAVLAHEIGHLKYFHIGKMLLLYQVDLFINFFVFSLLRDWDSLYHAFGFRERHSLVALIVITKYVMLPYILIFKLVENCCSWFFEQEANTVVEDMKLQSDLGSAIVKLYEANLTCPVYDHLYVAGNLNQPSLAERLAKVQRYVVFKDVE